MKRTILAGAVVLALVSIALSADFWSTKPYTKWSQFETERMLTDSPWAKTTSLHAGNLSRGVKGDTKAISDAEVQPIINYSVSIRSAMPVRQANVRRAAILKKYEKMDAAAKQEFDDKWNKYLAMKFPDAIIFAVNYQSNDPQADNQLVAYFQTQTLDTMKQTTMLSIDKQKFQPVAFVQGPHELQIAFERPKEMAANSAMTLEFKHPDIKDQPAHVISTKFSLKDMMFEGAPAY
jgi:hypothetical protein